MNRRWYTIIITMATLALLGIGCGSQTEPTMSTSTEPLVIKPPASVLELEERRLAPTPGEATCESRGFRVIARFDSTSQETVSYCQFDDGSECRLNEYAAGTCGPGQGAARLTNPHLRPNTIVETVCSENDPPVCGVNGHSYFNRCIAIETGIPVAHEGMCTAAEIAANSPDREQSSADRATIVDRAGALVQRKQADEEPRDIPPPAVNDPAVKTQGDNPEWIANVIGLIEAGNPTAPRTYIDSCTIDAAQMYLESNGTDEVVSTLYDEAGTIICNPNRDFAGLCPATLASRRCSRLYTDSR